MLARHRCASTAWPPRWPSAAPRPNWPSRSATSSTATAFGATFRDWYLLPMIGCIWSCPTDQMLRFPVATHDPLLPQPRPDPGRPTGRSGTRCAAARGTMCDKMLRGIPDARLNTPVRSVRRLPPATARRRAGRHRRRHRALRRGRAGLPQRPGAGAAGRRHAPTSAPCSAPSATSPTAPCCTPTPRVLPRRRARLGGLELRARGRRRPRAGRGVPALPDQPPAAAALAAAGDGVAEPAARAARPTHGASASSTTPPGVRRRGHRRAAARCRALQGRAAPGSAAPGRATASTKTA